MSENLMIMPTTVAVACACEIPDRRKRCNRERHVQARPAATTQTKETRRRRQPI
jgi:hypothetical protein